MALTSRILHPYLHLPTTHLIAKIHGSHYIVKTKTEKGNFTVAVNHIIYTVWNFTVLSKYTLFLGELRISFLLMAQCLNDIRL